MGGKKSHSSLDVAPPLTCKKLQAGEVFFYRPGPNLAVCSLILGLSGPGDEMRRLFFLSSLLTLIVVGLGCLGSTGAGDKILFGTALRPEEDDSCTSDVTITYREVSLLEDGDVDAVYDASEDKGIAETDADGGTSWGYRSFETCIYPNVAFSGSIEFNLTTNGSYDGRMTATRSYPAAVDGEDLPALLSFTDSGAAERQCFTFTRIDDGVRNEVEDPFTITMDTITERDASGEVNEEGSYHGQRACDITVTMDDDEGPGIRVSNISRVMEEPGVAPPNDATFRVVLRTAPTANVTVPINASADPVNTGEREGYISDPTIPLTFTPANWNTEQVVTVTSVDDLEVDGIKIYTIAVENTTSDDSEYNGLDPRDVVIYNRDQSVPGYTYERFDASSGSTDSSGGTIDGFATDEANQMGTTYSTFRIRLRSKPSASVTLNFSTTCGSKCNLLTTSLVFDDTNWNQYQTVQVEGASDSANSGLQDYFVDFNASSSDPTYNTTVTEPRFRIRSCDNDAANLIAHCNFSGSPLGTSGSRFSRVEGGQSITWLITQSAPGSDVEVGLSSTDAAEGGTPAFTPVRITSANYNTLLSGGTNRVQLNHINDTFVNSPQTRDWIMTTATSNAPLSFDPVDIYAQTTDNEQYFYISRSGNTSEADTVSTLATIYVCLGASPNGTVELTPSCTLAGDECGNSFSPTSITWNAGEQSDATSNATCGAGSTNVRSFTINGADDVFADGNQNFTVQFSNATGTDSTGYVGRKPSDQSVSNVDNEPAGKAIFFLLNQTPGEMTAQGVQGADNLCNTNKPGYAPNGSYKALIMSNSGGEVNDRTTGIDWVINPSYYYYKCTGSGSNCNDQNQHMFIGSGFDPLNMTDHSSSPIYFANGEYWTGMTTVQSPATQTSTPGAGSCPDPAYRHNCGGFTYQNCPTDAGVFFYGQTWSVSGADPVENERICTTNYGLICVQQ